MSMRKENIPHFTFTRDAKKENRAKNLNNFVICDNTIISTYSFRFDEVFYHDHDAKRMEYYQMVSKTIMNNIPTGTTKKTPIKFVQDVMNIGGRDVFTVTGTCTFG